VAKKITIEITGKGDQLGRTTQQVERDLDKVAKKAVDTSSKFSGIGSAAKSGLSGLQGVGSSVVSATSSMEGGLTSLSGVVTTASSSLGPIGIAAGAIIGPLLGGTAALAAFGQTAADYGGSIGKIQRLTGMAAGEASTFAYAAQQTGVDVDGLGKSIKAMSTNLEKNPEKFAAVGVAVRDASGQMRPMYDILGDVAARFQGMEDGPEKLALATELFGRSGMDLIPMLNAGKDGLAGYRAEAEKYGLIMDDAGVAKARAVKGAQKDLAAAWQGFQVQLGQEVLPILKDLTQWLADHLPQAMEAIRPGIEFLKDAFGKVSEAFKVGGFQGAVDKIIEILGGLWDRISPILGPMFDKLVNAIGGWISDHIPDLLAAFGKWTVTVNVWIVQGIGKLLVALGGLLAQIGEWIWNVGLPKLLELFGEWGRAALSWIGDAIAKFPERVGYLVGAVVGWAIGFAAELPGHMLEAGKAVLSWIAKAVTEAPGKLADLAGKIWEFATSLPGKVVGWIGDVARTLWDKGTDLVRGLADGIKDAVGRFLQGALSGLIDFIPDWIKDKLGIHSPSTVTMALGRHIGEGLAVGIAGSQGLVESAMGGLSIAASGSVAIGQGTPTRSTVGSRFQPVDASTLPPFEVVVFLDHQVLARQVVTANTKSSRATWR